MCWYRAWRNRRRGALCYETSEYVNMFGYSYHRYCDKGHGHCGDHRFVATYPNERENR